MAQIIQGPVTVVRVDELATVEKAERRNKKLLTDLLSDVKSGKISVEELEEVLIHNNLDQLQGGTAGERYHLSQNQWETISAGVNFDQEFLASANNLPINSNNWLFEVQDTTNNINLLLRTGFKRGRVIGLVIPTGATIKHNQSINGEYVPMILGCGSDFTATKTLCITFWGRDTNNDGVIDEWIEAGGTTVAESLDFQDLSILRTSYPCDTVNLATKIGEYSFPIGWLSDKIVTNSGTALIDNEDVILNNYIDFTSVGTAAYIEIADASTLELIAVIPLSEAPRNVSDDSPQLLLRDRRIYFVGENLSWNGNKSERISIQNHTGLGDIEIEEKMWGHYKGLQVLEDNDYYQYVPANYDKTLIFN